MRIDYHAHTPLCRHAEGRPEDYLARAVERGLDEFGMSDHSPMPPHYDPDWRMERAQLGEYIDGVERARAKFPGLSVKLGLEGDFHPGTEDYQREVIAAHPWDYVIGSVHYLGDWAFDNAKYASRFEGADLRTIWARYFGLVADLARLRIFDIVGHVDLVKKFGHRPEGPVDDLVRPALREIKAAGMAMEINTSGLRRPCREIYPSRRIVELAFELGIPVTLGSDAHRPEEVGAGFDEAAALLASVGYRSIVRYSKRRPEAVPL